jgi:phage terminase small subunit
MGKRSKDPNTGLTAQQDAFCVEYVRNGGQRNAAYRASYNTKANDTTVKGEVLKLLDNPAVLKRIGDLQREVTEKMVDKAVVDKTWIDTRLKRVVERCMQASPVFDRSGNPVLQVTEDGQLAAVYAFDAKSATRALELLGKDIGMFVERKETGRPGEFDKLETMSKEELRRRAQEKAVRLGLGKVVQFDPTRPSKGKKRAA